MDRRGSDEIWRRTLARVGNPPHGEPPARGCEYQPDCPECQEWYERYKAAVPETRKQYLEEQSKFWKQHYKDVMEDLGISEEEIGGPLYFMSRGGAATPRPKFSEVPPETMHLELLAGGWTCKERESGVYYYRSGWVGMRLKQAYQCMKTGNKHLGRDA